MYLPIGSIIAWHKSLANTPALPAGWVECNGGVLDNPTSPYHGQEIPDLNGAARFLRGGASSGVLQDDALQGHFHEVHRTSGNKKTNEQDKNRHRDKGTSAHSGNG